MHSKAWKDIVTKWKNFKRFIYETLIFKIILQNNRYMSEVKVIWSYSILKMECNKHALFQMDFCKTRCGAVSDFLKVKKVVVWEEVTTFMVLERPVM